MADPVDFWNHPVAGSAPAAAPAEGEPVRYAVEVLSLLAVATKIRDVRKELALVHAGAEGRKADVFLGLINRLDTLVDDVQRLLPKHRV